MKKVEEHYNNWTVLYIGEPKKTGKRNCIVRCNCGRLHINDYYMAKTGKTKMCKACSAKITKNRTKHGLHNTRLYRIWAGIKSRCGKERFYVNVKYCLEWSDFEKFYKWAVENGYQDNLTIDRINPNGDYCPKNCRWATAKQQARNTKRNRIICYKGKNITLGELAEITGIKYDTLWARLKRGWSIEKSVGK
ncbi:MAG: hypothetical protein II453_03025 [Alphaproteobacteria bacterium]|nr:hypothetical protein [Alphaproteobacteria bacterium]MBQ2395831.1 hypothetical protein [Bacteroidales bacterium]MBQ3943964.1 hypothetical protein [Elusimicrobiota bacterium]